MNCRYALVVALFITGLVCARQVRADNGASSRTSPSEAHQYVERVVPPPPTRYLTLKSALRTQPRVRISRDAQRFRPEGSSCAGVYPHTPAYKLVLTAPQTMRIEVHAHNKTDVTIAIRNPDGSWTCNDDAGPNTHDSGTVADLSSGTHILYVGAYNALKPLDYQVSFSTAKRPDWARCDDTPVVKISRGETEEIPTHLPSTLYKCDTLLGTKGCDWYLPGMPSACLDLENDARVHIATSHTDFDTVLVVQQIDLRADRATAGERHEQNNDVGPGDGHSEIDTQLPAGRYAIFVGTYRLRPQGHGTLTLSATPPDTP